MSPPEFRFSRFFRFLLKRLTDEDMSASIEEDFTQRFAALAAERGPRRARCAMPVRQLSLLLSLTGESMTWHWSLLRSYAKSAVRQIVRRKGYSAINILGLTIGIAGFLLIGLWVRDELSFDRFHEHGARIHRVLDRGEDGNLSSSPTYALSPALADLYPEVEESVRAYPHYSSLVGVGDQRFPEFNFLLTDPGFFRMFSFRFLSGAPDSALASRDAVVLSESTARKYFGEENPLGRTLHLFTEGKDFQITGVIEDPPLNSTIRFDLAVRVELLGEDRLARWDETVGPCYVMLRPGTDSADFESRISGIYERFLQDDVPYAPALQPLRRVHLYENGRPGEVKKAAAFSVIAVFILLMACVNFMNLATARSVPRAREVGLRKVIGARRAQVIRQFLGEALVIAFIALILGVAVVELALPGFNRFTGKDLSLLAGAGPGLLLGLLITAGLTGLLAGSYPAFFLSSFHPVDTLRNRAGSERGASRLRKVLIVGQFAISVGLIVGTLVVTGQLRFVRNMDLGLDRSNVVGVYNTPEMMERFGEFKAELERAPGIEYVTSGAQPPTRVGQTIGMDWEGNPDEDSISIGYSVVDYDFFRTFGMRIIQGRAFSPLFPTDEREAAVINRTAARRMEMEDPIGRTIILNHPAWPEDFRRVRVIGVVNDFHDRSVHSEIRPFVFRMYRPWHFYGFVKVEEGRVAEALEGIEAAYTHYAPEYPFGYQFYDEFYDDQYRSERRLGSLFTGFSLLSIVIACLGLLGLSSYTVERRTKEIGIRKVLGASALSLIGLTSREFIKWVSLACLIAWPVSYWLMHQWLRDFVYKITLGPGFFLLAALLALAIALLTVGFHALRAARTDPVLSLRYE